jgi:hypothetical protein
VHKSATTPAVLNRGLDMPLPNRRVGPAP